jgi:hypothetical protein
MTTSSAPTIYSTTLNDTLTISNSTGSSYYYTGAGIGGSSGTITINNGGAVSGSIGIGTGNVTIGSIDGAGTGYDWNFKLPEEFVDTMPDFDRIQKMCEQYPGLKIAFEKFKTTYYLVKDHYDTPEDQRPLP